MRDDTPMYPPQNGSRSTLEATLGRLEERTHHLWQRLQDERTARLALRLEMFHLDELQQVEINELRKDREAMIRRYGAWLIYALAVVAGVFVSAVWNGGYRLDMPGL